MIKLLTAIKEKNKSEALYLAGELKKLDWNVYLDDKLITDGINYDFKILKLEIQNPKNQGNIITMLKENDYTMHFFNNSVYYARTNTSGGVIMPTVAVSDFKLVVKTNRNGCNLVDLETLIKRVTNINKAEVNKKRGKRIKS